MKTDPEKALKELKKVIGLYTINQLRSEADTRCKIIDRLFIDVLGWSEGDITREDHTDSGFSDYVFKINDISSFVLEAKKSGNYFELPKSMNRRKYKISGVIKTIDSLYDAILQARSYCLDTGIKYGIVTNGFQYILFPAFSVNKKWNDIECLVFNGFDDLLSNFTLFWNILSKESITDGALFEYIDKGVQNLQFKKVYFDIHNREQKWHRNRLYTYLRPICEFVFTELLDEAKTKVLNECYVFERSNRNLGSNLDEMFIDKLPYFSTNIAIKDIYEKEKRAGQFEKEFNRKIEESTLLLLLGGVGSGKSTFLHRFFKTVQRNKESLFWFYFDFRDSPFEESKIEEYIFECIYRQYKETYEKRIKEILEEVGFNQEDEDRQKFLFHLFALLKRIGISIVLVVDNVDQHDFNFQEKLFIYSNHISKEFKVLTILSIREETFLQSTQTGVFDAYDVPKFHISSPNFLNLIRKRIEFAIDLIKSDAYNKSFKDIKPEVKDELIHYFEILDRSLSKDNYQSRKIVQFFDNISVGNMREALSMFNSFLISGNTNIDEMFQKERHDNNIFQIAFHQMLKSIMLDEYRFYCSERSHIANLFDFDISIDNSHFNQLRILKVLIDKENSKSKIGRGYYEIDLLISDFNSLKISKAIVLDNLKRLSFLSLIIFDNQSKTDVEFASYVKVTASGKLYFNELIYQFGYLDGIVVDTPISSDETYSEIRRLINDTDLSSRVLRTKIFIEYLIESEKCEIENNSILINNEYVNTIFTEGIKNNFNSFVSNLNGNLNFGSIEDFQIKT